MFKDFYRTTFSFLKPLLFLLCLLLPFSLCIADGYISISPTWDEYTQKYKTYYFENGLDNFNKGQYKQAFKNFRKAQEYGIGLGSVYLAKMYLEGKGVKVDYKKAQLSATLCKKRYQRVWEWHVRGCSYFRIHASRRLRDEKGFETSAQDLQACGSHTF
ncbi:sel1 repeat superfamily protein [Helicobacter pylori]|nr:sel1 repeat superfamily protein [Helicobacter pylori]